MRSWVRGLGDSSSVLREQVKSKIVFSPGERVLH